MDHYSYDRRAGSSYYTPLLSKIVSAVDDIDEAVKKASQLEDLLEKLKVVVKQDTEFQENDPHGHKALGVRQVFEEMESALGKLSHAASSLTGAYDEMNRRFLDNGLK